MSRSTQFALAFAANLIALSAAAQTIPSGTWTGTVTPPDQEAVQVTFDVRSTADSTNIVLKSPYGDFPFHTVRIFPDRITFGWSPGTELTCSLARKEDASYSGTCTDTDGSSGIVVMQPPARFRP